MDSITRQLGLLCLGVLAAALTACAGNDVSQCAATGILCPSGMHCAAAEAICISDLNLCGNAHLDPGEVCDDGNTKDGDGCSADCKSDETCGNGRIDTTVGEVCDEPLKKDANGKYLCSANCKSNETCGNGVVDKEAGEICDDGNQVDGDGCSKDCKSDETCGNGIVDTAVGEVCDDGNTIDGDACSHCTAGRGCGNGIIDHDPVTHLPLEECDDGNIDNNDDCRNDCVVNRCGDGVLDSDGTHKEGCETTVVQSGGSRIVTPTESQNCNSDCTVPKCGDGKVNHSFTPLGAAGPEQCDNVDSQGKSLNGNDADCTANCQINVCGDGLFNTKGPNHTEACDDGDKIDSNGCSNACTLPHCGNGIVDQNEECDDGNLDNNDDCRNDCVVNRCGDGVLDTHGTHTEVCESAIVQSGGSRALTAPESQNCNNDCTAPKCGDGKVNHSFTPTGAAGPEQCDNVDSQGKSLDSNDADCTANCQINVCGDGLFNTKGPNHAEACDDGDKIDSNGCSNACTLPHCGNGIVDQNEECDDGNLDNNDDCRNDCVVNRCGDGVLDTHGTHTEVCESAIVQSGGARALTSPESQNCNNDCTAPKCGDGKVNHSFTPTGAAGPEQCDNVDSQGKSLDSNDADCTANCQINVCGDGLFNTKGPNHAEACDDGDKIDSNGCSNACTLPHCGNGIVDQNEECDDGNLDNNDDCRNDCVVNRCGDGVLDTHGTHTEVCESVTVQSGGARALTSPESQNCNDDCTAPKCGDGKVNHSFTPLGAAGPEQCDNVDSQGKSLDSNDADCTANCQINVCGDGLFNTKGPNHIEPCDDGNRIDADGCSNACTLPHCGNGIVDQGEQCDDGNTTQGSDACENNCTLPRCGNGIKDIGEECDDGNSDNHDDCTNACKFAKCGDGFLRTVTTDPPTDTPTVAESCDTALTPATCTYDPVLNPATPPTCSVCNPVCQLVPNTPAPYCGDGNTDPLFETCDSGTHTTACGACSPDCQVVNSHQATGFIFAAAGNDLRPTDTFTVSDGFHPATTFAFATASSLDSEAVVTIPFSTTDKNSDVANAIKDAINGVRTTGALLIAADRQGGVVTLTNQRLSSKGNGTLIDPRIVSLVVTPNFAVVDMAGGQGGDCDAGAQCGDNRDCASNLCTAHVCVGP